MDYILYEKLTAHLEDMRPCVPEWCAAERMEKNVPLKKLWKLIKHP